MKRDILYNPNIKYDKKYYTEGTFEKQKVENITQEIINKKSAIKKIENDIDKYLVFIPEILKQTYLSPYIIMKKELEDLEIPEEEIPEKIPEKNPDKNPDKNPEEKIPKEIPGFFDKGPDMYIDIKDPYRNKNKIQKNIYAVNFMDIYKDYVNKLNSHLQSYTYALIGTMNMTDKNHDMSSYSTKNIKNKNLYHIGDSLIRSNIVLSQKLRLHKKLFDMDETILHLKQIKVASAYIERYYSESKQGDNSDLASLSNAILDNSKKLADRKYNENYYALYKYLNSDVILFNESLKNLTQQMRSFSIIDKYDDERGN